MLLVRNCLEGGAEGEATLTSVVVPLDGSELSEVALPTVADLAEKLAVEILLLRVYASPYGTVAAGGRDEIHA